MGRQRQPQQPSEVPQQQPPGASAAAAAEIAALLLAGGATTTSVAAILLPFAAGGMAVADAINRIAEMVLEDPPIFSSQAGQLERRASLENLLLRGFYGIAATRRLAVSEDLGKALDKERGYFARHNEARQRNLEGARQADGARNLYGDLVSWNHGATRTPEEPRPNHVAADGKNWDMRRGIPVSTGALPGTLPHCTCAFGPPRAGAETLI